MAIRPRRRAALAAIAAPLALALGATGLGASSVTAAAVALPSGATAPMIADPGSINPILASDSYGRSVVAMLYPSLATVAPGGRVRPLLARSWRVLDKGLEMDIAIRSGLRWTDGAAVTAADVATTFAAMADRRDHSAYYALFGAMSDVKAHGADQLVVTLARPDATFLHAVLLVPVAPKSVVAPLLGRSRALAANADLNARPLITAGPFRFVAWDTATGTLRLQRNAAYPWGASRLRSLTIRYEPTAGAAWSAFLSGQLTLANVPAADTVQARALERAGKLRLISEPSATYTYIPFNMADPIWADPRVREAAILAVDRKAIASQLPAVLGTPTGGPPPLSEVATDGDMAGLGANLAKAERLLTAAGWKAGAAGVRAKDGKPLAFTLVTVAGVPLWDRYVGIVAYDLRLAGFDVTVTYQTFASLVDSLSRPAGPQAPGAWALAWTMTPGSDAQALFGGSAARPPGGQDVGGYADPRVTAAMNTLAVGASRKAMRAARASLRAALRADPPAIFLYEGTTMVATVPDLRLPRATVATGLSIAWAQDWYYARA